jgi:hypothetical protein
MVLQKLHRSPFIRHVKGWLLANGAVDGTEYTDSHGGTRQDPL